MPIHIVKKHSIPCHGCFLTFILNKIINRTIKSKANTNTASNATLFPQSPGMDGAVAHISTDMTGSSIIILVDVFAFFIFSKSSAIFFLSKVNHPFGDLLCSAFLPLRLFPIPADKIALGVDDEVLDVRHNARDAQASSVLELVDGELRHIDNIEIYGSDNAVHHLI